MMEPSWTEMQWITSFEAFNMGEPLILTRSDLPDDQPVNKHLGPSTTIPIAATTFSLSSSECVVDTIIKFPVIQPSSAQQNNFSSSQLVAANRTIYSLHN